MKLGAIEDRRCSEASQVIRKTDPPGTRRFCAVIPLFNNASTINAVVTHVRRFIEHIIVVDDGSTDGSLATIVPFSTLVIKSHGRNQGKGAAVKTGLRAAQAAGFTHVLQVDADGQHDLDDIPRFLDAAFEHPETLFAGERTDTSNMPRSSRMGRKFGIFWFRLETRGHPLSDTQCGFRIYPLSLFDHIQVRGDRMDFDVEVLVRAIWAKTPVVGVPTRVQYFDGEERVSSFRPVVDNLLFALMNIRLLPFALWWSLFGKRRTRQRALRARENQTSWWKIQERGSRLGTRLLFWIMRFTGYRAARLLVYPVTLYFFATASEMRGWIREFQLRALGYTSSRLAYRTLRNFAFSILDRALVLRGKGDRFRWTIHGEAILEKYANRERGTIVVGAHLGTLEIGHALTSRDKGIHVGMLMHEARSSMLYEEFKRINPRMMEHLIRMDGDSIGHMFDVRRRLKDGDFIGILGDRAWKTGPTIRLPFLGAEHDFPIGAYRIASLLDVPTLMLLIVKEGVYDYHLYIEDLSAPTESERGVDAIATVASRYVSKLEGYARQFPFQWYNFYGFWLSSEKTREL